jgi:cytochrome c-type biogenesis protein CcmH/NrfG
MKPLQPHRLPLRPVAALLIAAPLALLAPAVLAAGDGGGGSEEAQKPTASDPDFRAGVAAWKAKDWATTTARLQAFVARTPDNADAWNYLGHAARQSGDLANAFRHYDRALQIDPRHRGAHEYAGEAQLLAGNVTKAEEHLKALDRICVLPCEEYTDLKEKVQRWRREHAAK